MIIVDAKNNKISIKSDKDIEISAPNGKISIEAKEIQTKSSASTKIEATAKIDIKAPMIDVNASGTMNIKGTILNLN